MESQKSNRQKDKIRVAAFRLFFTDTFQSVTLKQIEQQLGISRGCVMYHYYSKQEIFSDVVDFYILSSNHREVNRQYYPTEQLRQSNAIKKNDSTHKA